MNYKALRPMNINLNFARFSKIYNKIGLSFVVCNVEGKSDSNLVGINRMMSLGH